MRKGILFIFIVVCSSFGLLAQRPSSLNPYDLNRPFGWATVAVGGGAFEVTGGSGSQTTLYSTGADQRSEIEYAVNNYRIVVLDGSHGEFLIGAGGINLNSDKSASRTIVGINGATLRQINSSVQFHSYLDSRAGGMVKHSGGYVSSTHSELQAAINADVAEKGTASKWYVAEGDELYVRGYLLDYLYENGMSASDALAEPVRNWGVFRINGGLDKDTGCNIIVRNINFVGPGSLDMNGMDAFCLMGCNNVWVDHCSFSDGLDGCLDITNTTAGKSSTNITISWCTFHYSPASWNHRFCSLFNGNETQTLNVTIANCIWSGGIYTRTPLCNHANVHQLNCLFDAPGSGLRVQNSSYDDTRYGVFLDHCYFAAGESSAGQTRTYITWEKDGKTCYNQCEGNYFANGESPASNVSINIPYNYTPIPSALVPSVLTSASGAGPTLTHPLVFGE